MPTIALEKLVPGVREDNLDFLVLWVESSRKGIPAHRVDLQVYSGHGQCSCEAFQFRFNKLMRQRAMPSLRLECSHIKKARRYLIFKVINATISRREQQAEQNKKAAGRVDKGFSKAASQAGRPGRTPPPAKTSQWPEDDKGDTPY